MATLILARSCDAHRSFCAHLYSRLLATRPALRRFLCAALGRCLLRDFRRWFLLWCLHFRNDLLRVFRSGWGASAGPRRSIDTNRAHPNRANAIGGDALCFTVKEAYEA